MALISLFTIHVFIALLLSLSWRHPFAESLAAGGRLASTTLTLTPPPSNEQKITTTPSARVFVAGISHTCTEEIIKSTFSEFGAVQNVLIVGQDEATKKRKRLPYCFVTFHDISSAQRAIEAPKPSTTETETDTDDASSSSVYKEIQYAMPKEVRHRSNAGRAKEMERKTRIEEFSSETNLMVQVQSTHLDRLVEYLHNRWNNNPQNNHHHTKGDNMASASNSCRVLGSTNANSRNVSMLFLSCGNPKL
eukprot:scaffold305519_cov58-Attheya_sp.AAC.1